MERDLSEFEICYFRMLSPKLLNSDEKLSGLPEIYREHSEMRLALKLMLLFSLLNSITYI